MRQRNAQFMKDAKAGKKPTRPSRSEQMAKRSPLNLWALGIVAFVIIGGGTCYYDTLRMLAHEDSYSAIRTSTEHLSMKEDSESAYASTLGLFAIFLHYTPGCTISTFV
jgi:hypothetical protein